LPAGLDDAIHSVEKLRDYANTIDTLAGLAGGAWLNLGSFNIN